MTTDRAVTLYEISRLKENHAKGNPLPLWDHISTMARLQSHFSLQELAQAQLSPWAKWCLELDWTLVKHVIDSPKQSQFRKGKTNYNRLLAQHYCHFSRWLLFHIFFLCANSYIVTANSLAHSGRVSLFVDYPGKEYPGFNPLGSFSAYFGQLFKTERKRRKTVVGIGFICQIQEKLFLDYWKF